MPTLRTAVNDTRRHLKDSTENVWTQLDIFAFVDEAIGIIKKTVPIYFTTLNRLTNISSTVSETFNQNINLDVDYFNLLGLFSAARCFEQDEQHYRAIQKMNEFESRKLEMEQRILESEEYAALLDAQGIELDVVRDVYSDTSTDILNDLEEIM